MDIQLLLPLSFFVSVDSLSLNDECYFPIKHCLQVCQSFFSYALEAISYHCRLYLIIFRVIESLSKYAAATLIVIILLRLVKRVMEHTLPI